MSLLKKRPKLKDEKAARTQEEPVIPSSAPEVRQIPSEIMSIDVSGLTMKEAVELRTDQYNQLVKSTGDLNIFDCALEIANERADLTRQLETVQEDVLKEDVSIAAKAIQMVDAPFLLEKQPSIKEEDLKKLAASADSARAAFNCRADQLKELEKKADENFSEQREKIREESRELRKQTEEIWEQIRREDDAAIQVFRGGPGEEDEEDDFGIGEEEFREIGEMLEGLKLDTAEIRARQEAEKEQMMRSLEQTRVKTTQNEKIASLKIEKAEKILAEKRAKDDELNAEIEKLEREIAAEEMVFQTKREEIVRLDEEERALADDIARQQDENDELDKQIAELSKVLEEQNALLSQEMAENAALAQKEVDLEKEVADLKNEYSAAQNSMSIGWTNSITLRREITAGKDALARISEEWKAAEAEKERSRMELEQKVNLFQELEKKIASEEALLASGKKELELAQEKCSKLGEENQVAEDSAAELDDNIKKLTSDVEQLVEKQKQYEALLVPEDN